MCGLVGVFGDITINTKKLFGTLLYLDVYRGMHSTGTAAIKNIPTKPKDDFDPVTIEKCLGGPWNLFEQSKNYERKGDDYKVYDLQCLMGHNRHATVGEVNLANSHPFDIGNIVGMHNGTLEEKSISKLDSFKDFEVDSQVLFAHIHDEGIEKAYSEIQGAMALTWYDREYDTCNILRNHQRPLWCAYTEDKKTLAWASEEWMLFAAFARCRETVHPGHGVMFFKPHHLYTLTLRQDSKVGFDLKELEPCKTSYALPPVDRRGYGHGGYYNNQEHGHNHGKGLPNTKAWPRVEHKKGEKHDKDTYENLDIEKSEMLTRGYANHILTKEMFKRAVEKSKGCSICQEKTISWENRNKVTWKSPTQAICPDCTDVAGNLDGV